MRLLTAGSLVRVQLGEPKRAYRITGTLFLFVKWQRPCALIAARTDGVRQSRTGRTNKTARGGCSLRRSRARPVGDAARRRRGRKQSDVLRAKARGAARQFPGSEWSLVRAGQGEPRRAGLRFVQNVRLWPERFSHRSACSPFPHKILRGRLSRGPFFCASGNRCAFSFYRAQTMLYVGTRKSCTGGKYRDFAAGL